MLKHQAAAHRGEQTPPEFHFKVAKKCQCSLERQVREAIRIQMRGMYNRCKLTRLVVDCEWEERMWKEAWAPRVLTIDEECVGESMTNKMKEGGRAARRGSSWTRKKE